MCSLLAHPTGLDVGHLAEVDPARGAIRLREQLFGPWSRRLVMQQGDDCPGVEDGCSVEAVRAPAHAIPIGFACSFQLSRARALAEEPPKPRFSTHRADPNLLAETVDAHSRTRPDAQLLTDGLWDHHHALWTDLHGS